MIKESEGIRSNHYTLADGNGVVEVNPYQVKYIQDGGDGTTVIHFDREHVITVLEPFAKISEHLKHVFGSRVKQWGPGV
ncbi:hypothetical protein [Methylobacterium sp. 391_Methyba4]|uniref:hypothetical protein n=1 Tax=Methylobacterium sp. 391_Methyba4 TaxID=3038924 RepID=UPI00241F54B5|nr:hypothetical protein [Methylobacterium sp. 391_Methyba4]WFS07802.1 hypothetical protein P9K36_00395 [Methylobacterium sp. 391_Methyba4]